VLELLSSDGTWDQGIDEGTASEVDAAITLGFAGYTHNPESGLYYYSQRYYDL
jgi:hypothetical protein